MTVPLPDEVEHRCPTCSFVFHTPDLFCRRCGGAIPQPKPDPSDFGEATCPKCHRPVVIGGRFCPFCAYDFEAPNAAPESSRPYQRASASEPFNPATEYARPFNPSAARPVSAPVSPPVFTAQQSSPVQTVIAPIELDESYKELFRRFDANGGKFIWTWNWSAFGGGGFWYLAKGMNKQGALWFVGFAVCLVLAVMPTLPLVPIMTGCTANWNYYKFWRAKYGIEPI